MANVTFELKHGLKPVETHHVECEIREATTGDIIDAQDAAEKMVFAPDGNGNYKPALAVSDHRLGVELALRQVVRIGGIKGDPLDLETFRQLHPEDMELINEKLQELDSAVENEALANRGRDQGVGEPDQ